MKTQLQTCFQSALFSGKKKNKRYYALAVSQLYHLFDFEISLTVSLHIQIFFFSFQTYVISQFFFLLWISYFYTLTVREYTMYDLIF